MARQPTARRHRFVFRYFRRWWMCFWLRNQCRCRGDAQSQGRSAADAPVTAGGCGSMPVAASDAKGLGRITNGRASSRYDSEIQVLQKPPRRSTISNGACAGRQAPPCGAGAQSWYPAFRFNLLYVLAIGVGAYQHKGIGSRILQPRT
jgi:hypothetical protein